MRTATATRDFWGMGGDDGCRILFRRRISFAVSPGEIMNRLAKGLLFGIACALLAPVWAADAPKDDDKKASTPE